MRALSIHDTGWRRPRGCLATRKAVENLAQTGRHVNFLTVDGGGRKSEAVAAAHVQPCLGGAALALNWPGPVK